MKIINRYRIKNKFVKNAIKFKNIVDIMATN